MSRNRRGKKKSGAGAILFLSFLILVGGVVLLGLTNENFIGKIKSMATEKIKEKVKEKAEDEIMEQAIEKALQITGDPQAAGKAKEIMDSMDQEDKQAAKEMVKKYVNPDTISDVTDMANDTLNGGSISDVKEYLQENVSEEDQQQLKEWYQKYSQGQ